MSFKCWGEVYGKDIPTALGDRSHRRNDLAGRMGLSEESVRDTKANGGRCGAIAEEGNGWGAVYF